MLIKNGGQLCGRHGSLDNFFSRPDIPPQICMRFCDLLRLRVSIMSGPPRLMGRGLKTAAPSHIPSEEASASILLLSHVLPQTVGLGPCALFLKVIPFKPSPCFLQEQRLLGDGKRRRVVHHAGLSRFTLAPVVRRIGCKRFCRISTDSLNQDNFEPLNICPVQNGKPTCDYCAPNPDASEIAPPLSRYPGPYTTSTPNVNPWRRALPAIVTLTPALQRKGFFFCCGE